MELKNINISVIGAHFPLILPKSLISFVNFLVCHSMFLTISTPLARIFRGQWMGVASIQTLVNKVPGLDNPFIRTIVPVSNETIYGDAQFIYSDERSSPGIDRAFGLHAFFGITWILTAHIQMVFTRKQSLSLHQKFGYFAILTFFAHMGAALNNLIFDEAKHHMINRVGLGSLVFLSTTWMLLSIKAAMDRDIPKHKDYIIRCFLYSIEGAGTIRTIAYLQYIFSPFVPEIFAGPAKCQAMFGGQATYCVLPYFIRGIFTRLLTLFYIAIYTSNFSSKKDKNLVNVLMKENLISIICLFAYVMVDQIFHSHFFF